MSGRTLTLAVAGLMAAGTGVDAALTQQGGQPAGEDAYYRIVSLPIPEHVVLEVGGLAALPDGRLAASTRRGEIWLVENPYIGPGERPHFSRFAHGLHEPLGLGYRDGSFYTAQRGELTRLTDTDGDGEAELYETVYSWPLSGNYHEYSYGPVFTPEGDMLVTLNLAWVGKGASLAKWRGWALEITEDGRMTPIATGMRSPAGFGYDLEGELFYAENQGDWVGSGGITHVEKGDFLGNPAGLRWTSEPGSPLTLRPEEVPNTGEPKFVVAERVEGLKPPSVWFPHTLTGISTSEILVDSTGGRFGPFEGQLFVGDQGHSKILRVFLERVDGVYQGAVFPFREGFDSGVLRMVWGRDGSMFVGQTSRGWAATGTEPYALQRLIWTGRTPFEAEKMEARPDGFEITFTKPVDPATAADPSSYSATGFIYHYHQTYGSPAIDQLEHPVRAVKVSGDGLRARLVVDGLREGYIHELKMEGVRSAEGAPLLHDVAYYTLNRIPGGETLRVSRRAAPGPAARPPRATPPTAGRAAKRALQMPADWGGDVDVTLNLGTLPGMRYDLPELTVKAGSRVRFVFTSDDDMLHNVVFTLPGEADEVARAALELGLGGQQQDYVPPSETVLFHTALLQPDTSETIYFRAPLEPGEYTYVCTFPGHSFTMRGTLEVVP